MPNHQRYQSPHFLGLTFWGQWVIAMFVLMAILYLLGVLKWGELEENHRLLAVLTVFCSVPIYTSLRVFDRRIGYFAVFRRLTLAWILLLAILAFLAFATKTGQTFSREVVLSWALLGFIGQSVAFVPLHSFSRRYHSRKRKNQKSLILGTGDLARKLAARIRREGSENMVGLVHHDDTLPTLEQSRYLILGGAIQLRALIQQYSIKKIYIALPAEQMGNIENVYIDLMDLQADVIWVPDFSTMMLLNQSVSEVAGIPAIHLNESPLTANPSAALLKAALDRTLAMLGILALSPLLLMVAVAVRLSSPGPVLFKQPRHGFNGQIFQMWKFRSMRLHNDSDVKQATRNDTRITPVGRFIRRTSIDELPQFFNVLFGNMSLVGPRPHAVAHNDYYSEKIQAYMNRHRIKPGITGLAQIRGARGETETLEKMERRVQLDLEYINNWSLWLDIKILLKTPLSLFSRNAY